MPGDPFEIHVPPDAPLRRAALMAARPLLSWALQLQTLGALYRTLGPQTAQTFPSAALGALDITVHDAGSTAAHVPARGPVIVVANHPHGALDGLALLTLVNAVRSDVRLLANHLLARIPELCESCFFVDPFDGRGAASRNVGGLRAARQWLAAGGAAIAFPAGEVAHRWESGRLLDSAWKTSMARLAHATHAQLVPAFIDGRNRRLFYLAGTVHPAARTVLLSRELLAQRGRAVRVSVGTPLDTMSRDGDARAITSQVRASVDGLANTQRRPAGSVSPASSIPYHGSESLSSESAALSVAAASRLKPDTSALAREMATLPASTRLLENGAFEVYCAEAGAIPLVLQEIGRLRELAYRAVGEGTGRDRDLDTFDDHYLHLFSWNRERREIIGAYRIGRADRIVERQGVEGLYTRTLFRYDAALIDRMSPALELGRSFVRSEYQRNHTALLLLWRGICRFITQHPQYRVLFGAVSISARYSDMSKHLLMMFLEQNSRDRDLAAMVSAMHPPAKRGDDMPTMSTTSCEAVERLVSRAEHDGKGMPVLLRQYLKLNAKLLGFNVDTSFGDVLDALMMVDLARMDESLLKRYFGASEAAAYLACHKRRGVPNAA